MKKEDVVNLIQHYRHDVLNHLQIVQGYIKLNNVTKADASMDELLEYFEQERKLLSLNMPSLLLWFLQFRIKYEHFIMSYDIDIENKDFNTALDSLIVEKLEEIMKDIQMNDRGERLYQVEIELKDSLNSIEVAIYINMDSSENNEYQTELEDIERSIESNERTYHFQVPINNEVN